MTIYLLWYFLVFEVQSLFSFYGIDSIFLNEVIQFLWEIVILGCLAIININDFLISYQE